MEASADEFKNDNFQIPLIDLQGFCQDELNTAARLFGDFPETKFNSMVSPKIDKSIFNESAGSRRQTYSGGRVSRRRKEPILNSRAEEDSQEISMSSPVNFSSSRGKSGNNKNSSKSILDLVGKFLYILNKEEKNRLNIRGSLSSHASEKRDVLSVPLFKELKKEDHKKEDFTISPNIQETENICEILRGGPEMEGGILNIQKSFENAEGLEEYRSKVLDNARPNILNARKIPQVSKEDSELEGGMGRVRMLSEGLERPQNDQNKVVVNSSPRIAESGNASAVLGRDTEGVIWGIRKLLKTSDRLQEGHYKVVVNASPRLLEANFTSEVVRGSLEMEEDNGEIKNSIQNFEGFQVSGEIIEHSVYVRPEQESNVSGEENIDTQHRLQVWSQERQLCEQVQGALNVFDRLVETSELQNRGNVYEKQSQVDTFCAELHGNNAEGDIDTVADAMDRLKKKRGRPKKKTTEWGSTLSMDTKKKICEREHASDATNQGGEPFVSDSRKRVRCGFPCSASQEDVGDHLSSESRKRVRNGLSRGASKDGNELGVETQFYHKKNSSEAASLDGKEISSDASVAGDIIAKPIGPANDRAANEKCKGDVTEKANAAAELKEEKLVNRKNERDMLSQMSRMKKQKLLPADDFLDSWKNRLPNGWKVEVGLQRTESGKYDYYHKFVSPDGVQFPELNEISKYESSLCRQENDVKGSSGTNGIEFCNISPACYGGSNQRSDISYEEDRNEELNTSGKLDSPESMSIPSDSNEVRVGTCIYVCKHCGKIFDCYHHYVGHVAAHARTFEEALKLKAAEIEDKQEDINEEFNTSSKLKSPESMPIPLDSDEARVEAHIYVCKLCGNNFNCYRHFVGHAAAHAPTLHRKRGRPRLRGKLQNVPLPEKKEDKDDQIISNENLQSTSVKEPDNPDKLKRKVGRPRVRDSDCHKEMHCYTGFQSRCVMLYVNQAGSKENANEPQNSNIMDTDSGHATLSGGTPVLVNTAGLRKRGRPRKIKEPIFGYNNKDDDRNYTNSNRDDFVDTDCGRVMQSAGTPVLVNTFGSKRKRGRPRKSKEPICSNDNHYSDRNYSGNDENFRCYQDIDKKLSMCKQSVGLQSSIDQDAYVKIDGLPRYVVKTQDEVYHVVDPDCGHDVQSAGTPVLVNTVEPKRKPGRPRIIRLKRKPGRPGIVGRKRKPGRPRKIKEPICSNDNHDDERNYTDNDRDKANNSFGGYQNVEENLSMCEQSAGLQNSTDRNASEKIDGLPRYGDKTQDGVHYFGDTDCGHATQSAGTPVLGNTVGKKRKPGRPRTVRPKGKPGQPRTVRPKGRPGRPRKIKEPTCSNDNHDNERNYSGNDRDEANNSFRSYQDVEENLSMCKQSIGLQTSIDRDAFEKIDGPPRCGDKTQDGVHYFVDTDCGYAVQSAGTPVLVNTVGPMRKPERLRKIKEPICSNDNHDDERNCTSIDRDEANNSFWSYEDVKENLSMCKQSACLQASIDRDAHEKIDGLPRYGHKTQDEVHYENSIESVGVLALVDQDGQNNWEGQQRLRDDSKDTAGDLASTDPSIKRDNWSRLKDEMQVKEMDCSNDSQPLDAQGFLTQVGEKKELELSRKFQVPICSDNKLDDKINNCSSSGNQDEERHCQCDNQKDEMMRISLDGELNFSKIDQSMHVMAPVFLDRSENFVGMQKFGKITQDEEMTCGKTFQYVGLVENLDPDEQSKWFEQPRVKDDRQDVEPSYQRTNQWADSENPVNSASPLENINLDSTLQEYGTYQNSSKRTDDCLVEADTLFPLFPAVNIEKLDLNKIMTSGNAQVPFVDLEIKWDHSQFVVCQWCDQDFDFSSVSHLGSPCSWICPGCKTVNNVNSL